MLRWLLLLVAVLSFSGCGPQPPETFLHAYFKTLLVEADREAALANVVYQAGSSAPEGKSWCFDHEEPFVTAAYATFAKAGATDTRSRRPIYAKWMRDKWITLVRQHTTRTTATVRVRFEAPLLAGGGIADAKALELDYVLLRDDDGIWRVNEVKIPDHEHGGEFGVESHEKKNAESEERNTPADPWRH
ncbi:MAG: hypothetical protein ABI743_06910 [bacterium]